MVVIGSQKLLKVSAAQNGISQGKDRTSWVAEIKNVEDRIYCRFVIPLRRVFICEAFIS